MGPRFRAGVADRGSLGMKTYRLPIVFSLKNQESAKKRSVMPIGSFRFVLPGLALALAGCAPSLVASPPGPGVPRISNLEILPGRVQAGCPAVIRFQYDDLEGDIVRAVAHWSSRSAVSRRRRISDSGFLVLPTGPQALANTTGTAGAWVTPQHVGTYKYHVQVEDAAGRTSNILEGWVRVERPSFWAKTPPTCDGLDSAAGRAGEVPSP